MAKTNQTGRSKFEPYIKLHHGVTNSEAWKSLSCQDRALLIEIWARHNGVNNGQIPYSHREAQQVLHIGNGRVQQSFRNLEDRGFIIPRTKGSFNLKKRHATEWEITTEPCDGQPATRLYRDWAKKTKPGS